MTTVQGHDPEHTPIRELSLEEREAKRQQARQELSDVTERRLAMIGRTAVTQVRVRALVRPIDEEWVEVALQLRLTLRQDWLNLTPEDSPLLVARRPTPSQDPQLLEVYAISALRQVLEQNGAKVLELSGPERAEIAGQLVWSYWAHLSGPLSVAVHTNPDSTITILGMP